MPRLIAMYIRQVLIGFALSAIFVGALLYTNVGNLWHLVSTSDIGWIAVLMLFMFNGIVFSGVQFAIAIMSMAKDEDKPRGGRRDRLPLVPEAAVVRVPVRAEAHPRR